MNNNNDNEVTLAGNSELDVDEAVKLYVELRNEKAAMKAWLAEATKPIDAAMKQVESLLLQHMQNTKVNSVSTNHGVAYQRVVRSATIKDRKAFQDFVIALGLFDLVDWKANKVQVFDYMEENKTEVPGVNTSAYMTVGVRKGSDTGEDE